MSRQWSTIAHLLSRLQVQVLPPICLLCGGSGGADRLDLCDACRSALPRANALRLPPFGVTVCPWSYAYPIDYCIRAFKFQGERAWARVFGNLLARARAVGGGYGASGESHDLAAGSPAGPPTPDLIVPVPLHLRRLRERGYNQSGDLARFAAAALALPLAPRALERCRATAVQSTLPAAARAANVAGAFRATGRLKGLRIALVDDVLTTGSTARAAAAALIEAGAAGVELWIVARSARADAPQRRTAYSSTSPPSTTMPK